MSKELTEGDLQDLLSWATREHAFSSDLQRLPGMTRDLTAGERVAVAHYRASYMLLNRQGAIKEGWLGPLDNLAGRRRDDIEPEVDEHSWSPAPKDKRKRP